MLTEPCPWPTTIGETGSCCTLPDGVLPDDPLVTEAIATATALLWARTGRRYGVCPVEVRPYRDACATTPRHGCNPCRCGGECAVSIYLDGLRVSGIDEVVVDGITLDPSAYVLVAPSTLIRVDGGCWPSCPDLTSAGDRFSVTVLAGIPLDAAGITAVTTLACELVRACTPGCECALPSHATSISSQGVSVSLDDWRDLLEHGLFGLDEVDRWVAQANPANAALPAAVWSPDRPASPARVRVNP